MKKFHLFLLCLLYTTFAVSQPVFDRERTIDLPFQIDQFAVNGDGDMLVLSEENQIYLVNDAGNIENISDRFNLSEGSVFTVLEGTRSSRIYIGTSRDYLFEYNAGELQQFNEERGLEGDSITSVYERVLGGGLTIYVGTNNELFVSRDRGESFVQNDLNADFNEGFACIVYEAFSSHLTIESQGPRRFNSCGFGEPKVIVSSFSGTFETVFNNDLIPGNVLSRFTRNTSRFNSSPTFVMATDQGIYTRFWGCRDPEYTRASDLIINSFLEIELYPSLVFADSRTEVFFLAASDQGIYQLGFSGSDDLFTLISGTEDLEAKSIQFNICAAQLVVAGSSSLTILQAQVDYDLPTIDLTQTLSQTEPMTICEGEEVVLESTADGFYLYEAQWLKDGETIAGENQQSLVVTEPGDYSIQYNNCLFDQVQETPSVNINYFERPPVEIVGEPIFRVNTIQFVDIETDDNDSLYFVNDELLDDNSFAIKSDTVVTVKVLTKDNCTFSGEFEFSTVVSASEELADLPLNVYPNPFVAGFFIDVQGDHDADVRVFDLAGNEVAVAMERQHQGEIWIEMDNNSPGIYLVKIAGGGQIITKRIIKR